MVNEMLVAEGLARVAVYPPDVKYVDQLRATEKKAKSAKLGIWSIENYVTDRGYDTSVAATHANKK
jgi:micrococcal nuclease